MRKTYEVTASHEEIRQLQALTERPPLSMVTAREVASIKPTGPPRLSASSFLAVSVDPVKPSTGSKLAPSKIHAVSIKPTEPETRRQFTFSKIETISVEPTEPVSPRELSNSPTFDISIDQVPPAKPDENPLACRKCHEPFPSDAALVDHLYSNCRNPVFLIRRAAKRLAEKAVYASKTTTGRLVPKVKAALLKHGLSNISTKHQDLKIDGLGEKLARSPTRVTI
jgi:hypothetical protein